MNTVGRTNSQKQDDKNARHGMYVTGLVVLLLWIVSVFICASVLFSGSTIDIEALGNAGDFFGGLGALLSGLTMIGFVYTIYNQQQQLKLQRQEFNTSRDELRLMRESHQQMVDLEMAKTACGLELEGDIEVREIELGQNRRSKRDELRLRADHPEQNLLIQGNWRVDDRKSSIGGPEFIALEGAACGGRVISQSRGFATSFQFEMAVDRQAYDAGDVVEIVFGVGYHTRLNQRRVQMFRLVAHRAELSCDIYADIWTSENLSITQFLLRYQPDCRLDLVDRSVPPFSRNDYLTIVKHDLERLRRLKNQMGEHQVLDVHDAVHGLWQALAYDCGSASLLRAENGAKLKEKLGGILYLMDPDKPAALETEQMNARLYETLDFVVELTEIGDSHG